MVVLWLFVLNRTFAVKGRFVMGSERMKALTPALSRREREQGTGSPLPPILRDFGESEASAGRGRNCVSGCQFSSSGKSRPLEKRPNIHHFHHPSGKSGEPRKLKGDHELHEKEASNGEFRGELKCGTCDSRDATHREVWRRTPTRYRPSKNRFRQSQSETATNATPVK